MSNSNLGKAVRVARYLGAGLVLRGLRKPDEAARNKAARHLEQRLGRLHGLPQKIGQILSMSSDSGMQAALAPLRAGASGCKLDELLGSIEEAWGQDPYNLCDSIESDGLSASLGQVHRATLKDGREVAIKVRYPGIRAAVKDDLQTLGWLSIPVGNLRNGFDLEGYQEAIALSLEEELDYAVEAENQAAVLRAAAGTNLIVPEVISELSSEGVLTTIWETGESLEDAQGWSAKEKKQLENSLVRHFLELTFEHGLVHADPHPGNYAFRRSATGIEIVLYDYGCLHRPTETERLCLLRLMRDATERDAVSDPYPLFVELGFDADLLRPLRHKLAALCTVLFEPFAAPSTYDVSKWNRAERVAGILGNDRLNFRAAGSPRLLFFLRAFEGLCFYLRELGEPAFWSRPFRELITRQKQALDAVTPDEPNDPSATYGCLATSLSIHVTENGASKAQITLPAGAVERLGDFIDDELEAKIKARGIQVETLIEQVRANHYAPQPIFSLQDGERHIEIKLE